MDSFTDTWALICDYCKTKITDVAFQTWFARLVPVSLDFDEGIAVIQAPNEFHKQTLLRCYSALLKDAFVSVFGADIQFKLCVAEDLEENEKKDAGKDNTRELTFDNFVIGPSNQFAQAAAQAVANKPASIYNPLFIYGNSGLGKTHLLYAIRNKILENNPAASIQYVKGDDFTNEMIESIRKGTTALFREKFRKADVLLVDDIQFIAGKDSTQEEFFHTFNSLHESHKQIILTSDRPPKDIATLEDRLKTRFEWGLIADIQPPDFETRMAILTRKAELLEIDVPQPVIEYIATKLKSNIRQLEGAIKKLKAYSLLEGQNPSIITAQAAISETINNNQPAPVTIDKIIDEVARTYGVTATDIRSSKRNASVSGARQVAIYVVREITDLPLVEIGAAFGGRDHSTVVYALQQMERNFKKDKRTKDQVDDIIKNIRDM